MSVLDTLKNLISVARAKYLNDYGYKSDFVEDYMEDDNGFLKQVKESGLTFPIQFEEEGDFYFFNTEKDVASYVIAFLENDGVINDDDDYYSSSEFDNSGCE